MLSIPFVNQETCYHKNKTTSVLKYWVDNKRLKEPKLLDSNFVKGVDYYSQGFINCFSSSYNLFWMKEVK